MIPIHIKIGDYETLGTENWAVIPDDRQTRVETIGGIEIQDFGRVPEGDSYSCKATMESAVGAEVAEYWHNRTKVTVRDTGGVEHHGMRVIIKKYGYVDRFEEFFWAELEFWRK